MPQSSFPLRTVHLDFHTGPDVPGVGADFDAERFAATFKAAHVDSVTVFGTCHHGHAYYRTEHSLPPSQPGARAGPDRIPDRRAAPCRDPCADLYHLSDQRVRRQHPSRVVGRAAGRAARQADAARVVAGSGPGAARRLAGAGHVQSLPGLPRRADRRGAGAVLTGGRHLPGHVLGPAERVRAGRWPG